MASKVTAVEDTGDAIIIFIAHLDSDSFSRSVNRAANKVWLEKVRSNSRGDVPRFMGAKYAHTDLGDRTCMSTVVYGKYPRQATDTLNRLHPNAI